MSGSGTLGLEGRTIIITGAARGIGLAAVERFAAERCRILALDLDGSEFTSVKDIAARTLGEVITLHGDVSRETDWARAMDTALNAWGRVDILFNNAGISGPTIDVTRYPVDAFDRVIDVNVRGVFLGMKYAAQHMKTRGRGVIINVSSISGSRGGGNIFGYTASKHAVNWMTQSAAVSLARHGVRVVAVCPLPDGHGNDVRAGTPRLTGRSRRSPAWPRRRHSHEAVWRAPRDHKSSSLSRERPGSLHDRRSGSR